VFMFFLEGFSKVLYLFSVTYVSYADCGAEATCVLSNQLNWGEVMLVVLTGCMFEFGEIISKNGLTSHMADIWNALDMMSNSLVLSWLVCRPFPPYHDVARGFLALSAVPMSIGLLRFLSTFQYLGQLVIIIFAMSQVRRCTAMRGH
jgi:hypothetical protein